MPSTFLLCNNNVPINNERIWSYVTNNFIFEIVLATKLSKKFLLKSIIMLKLSRKVHNICSESVTQFWQYISSNLLFCNMLIRLTRSFEIILRKLRHALQRRKKSRLGIICYCFIIQTLGCKQNFVFSNIKLRHKFYKSSIFFGSIVFFYHKARIQLLW